MSVSLWGSFILSALEVTDAYAIKRINIYHKNLVHINFTHIYVYIDSKYQYIYSNYQDKIIKIIAMQSSQNSQI